MKNKKQIEELEHKYLNKFYHFLKFVEDEMMRGFATKEEIKSDWFGKYDSKISNFAVGAERIIYALFNGKGIGQPNSCPVGADMFFEVEDAFIHIDLKTVQTRNIGDITKSIFVGRNQNSYKGKMIVGPGQTVRDYEPQLPTFYNRGKLNEKVCLSYFVTILYDKDTLDTLVMSIVSMPNGELESIYGTDVLAAGKNLDKSRFRFTSTPKFRLLDEEHYRVKVIVFKKDMDTKYKSKLKFFEDLFKLQNGF